MKIIIRAYKPDDIQAMAEIWNEVVLAGNAFPQTEQLDYEAACDFFASQSYCGVAEDEDTSDLIGLFILHPNNIGRCGHIANASYAVRFESRGAGAGRALVAHSLEAAKNLGFRIMQFNAVVRSNTGAIALYENMGFIALGVIPGGFRMIDGTYEDIVPFYKIL